METTEKLLKAEEVAVLLRVSLATLGRWRKRGLPHMRGPGKVSKTLYNFKDVKDWLYCEAAE